MATHSLDPQDELEAYLEPAKVDKLHKWASSQIADDNRSFSPITWWLVLDLQSLCSTMKGRQEKEKTFAKETDFVEARENAEKMEHLAV